MILRVSESKNEFKISNKIVPEASLQDLILKYSEIIKKIQ